jgi:hypothetical protein
LAADFRNLSLPQTKLELTLLDSSPSCLAQLRERYEKYQQVENVDITFVCADVGNYNDYLSACTIRDTKSSGNSQDSNETCAMNRYPRATYDVIVDKGLLDALLCNEGWEPAVTSLLLGSCDLLAVRGRQHAISDEGLSAVPSLIATEAEHPTSSGRYLLISYSLPKATREYLIGTVAEKSLQWTFDLPGSNQRVQISQASFNVQSTRDRRIQPHLFL